MGIGTSGGALGPLLPGSAVIKSLLCCMVIIGFSFVFWIGDWFI